MPSCPGKYFSMPGEETPGVASSMPATVPFGATPGPVGEKVLSWLAHALWVSPAKTTSFLFSPSAVWRMVSRSLP